QAGQAAAARPILRPCAGAVYVPVCSRRPIPAESWARLAAQGYSLVIADWRLPDGDGSVIADGAADLGAKTFIMSGYLPELPSERREGHQCMMKPVRLDTFLAAVHGAIGKPTGERATS